MIPNGISKLTKEDKEANRPYTVGALYTPFERTNRLWKYDYKKEWIIDQKDKDTCGGNSVSLAKSIQEGRWMSALFTWLMARIRSNMALNDFGVNNRDLAMATKKVGTLLFTDSPYTNDDPREVLIDVTKWDVAGLSKKALPFIAGSVVWVEPQYGLDAFDMWCAATERFEKLYGKPCPAVFGFMWNYDIHSYRIVEPMETGSGHDMVLIGREEADYATALQSYGLDAGKEGEVKISRAIINRHAENFGMFILIDATTEQVEQAIKNGITLDADVVTRIKILFLNKALSLLKQLLDTLKFQNEQKT